MREIFEPGDRFWVASIRGIHFTVIRATGNELQMVDQHRRPWNAEYSEDSMFISAHNSHGLGRKVDMGEVNISE